MLGGTQDDKGNWKPGGLLGLTIECGRGQQATAAIEGLIDYLEPEKKYLVFVITDYDYYGFLIMDSLIERASAMGLDAKFVRIGVNPDQVEPSKLEQNKYLLKLEGPKEKAWAEKYAIDGKYGLEIQALTGPELRKVVADAIYSYCSVEELYNLLLNSTRHGIWDEVAIELYKENKDYVEKQEEVNKKLEELEERIKQIREEIGLNHLENQLEKLRTELYEKYRKKALDIAEKVDDRKIPWEFLKEQIIEGKTSLEYHRYTDVKALKRKIKEIIK